MGASQKPDVADVDASSSLQLSPVSPVPLPTHQAAVADLIFPPCVRVTQFRPFVPASEVWSYHMGSLWTLCVMWFLSDLRLLKDLARDPRTDGVGLGGTYLPSQFCSESRSLKLSLELHVQ